MILLEIWNAQGPWRRLSALKKPPKVAYRLMKYGRLIHAELEVCEIQRARTVCETAGVDPESPEAASVTLKEGTPEYATFLQNFREYLLGESDLKPVGMELDTLIDALDAETGNVLSDEDLVLLEPLFQMFPPGDVSERGLR